MTRTLLACFCIALVASAASADDDLNKKVDAFFSKFDTNKDGTVTPDEFTNDRIFKRLDTNADGKITRADFGAAADEPKKKQDAPRTEQQPKGDRGGEHGGHPGRALLNRFDKNRDGQLTREELRGHERLFHQLDRNNDNVVDKQELSQATQEQLRALHGGRQGEGDEMGGGGSKGDEFRRGQPGRGEHGGRMGPAQHMLKQGDTNGDGKLSEAEWLAMQKDAFKQMDKNGDGSVDAKELEQWARERMQRGRRGHGRGGEQQGRMSGEMAKRIFKRMDRNGDGSITKDEAPERLPFDQVDKNGDGKVSEAEFTEAFKQHMQRRGGGEGGGGRRGPRGQEQKGQDQKKDMDSDRRPGGGDAGSRIEMILKRLDKDGDGAISKAEWPAERADRFDKLDANGDGKITKEELKQAFERFGGKRRQQPRDN